MPVTTDENGWTQLEGYATEEISFEELAKQDAATQGTVVLHIKMDIMQAARQVLLLMEAEARAKGMELLGEPTMTVTIRMAQRARPAEGQKPPPRGDLQ